MPLIIITGIPYSGKTKRSLELKSYFETQHNKNVELVSEDDAIAKLGYEKNTLYHDFQKEKQVRQFLKSEVIRLIGKDNVVIFDGSNYIKGFRYELYCASKASKSTQCTVYTIANINKAWEDNERLLKQRLEAADNKSCDETKPKVLRDLCNKETFDALVMRYEEPNSQNRWDSPLFTVQQDTELDLEAVYKVLFEKKPPPPNMSTQNPPLSSTNFLYDLDRVTQDISKQILDAKKLNVESDLKFANYPDCVLESGSLLSVQPAKLLRLRRQFLTYAKMQYANEDVKKIGRYYLQYLNNCLQE